MNQQTYYQANQPQVIPNAVFSQEHGLIKENTPKADRTGEALKAGIGSAVGAAVTIGGIRQIRNHIVDAANNERAFQKYKTFVQEHLNKDNLAAIKTEHPKLAETLSDVKNFFMDGNWLNKANRFGFGRDSASELVDKLDVVAENITKARGEDQQAIAKALGGIGKDADALPDLIAKFASGPDATGETSESVVRALLEVDGNKVKESTKAIADNAGEAANKLESIQSKDGFLDILKNAKDAVGDKIKNHHLTTTDKVVIAGAIALTAAAGAAYGIHQANKKNEKIRDMQQTAQDLDAENYQLAAKDVMLETELAHTREVAARAMGGMGGMPSARVSDPQIEGLGLDGSGRLNIQSPSGSIITDPFAAPQADARVPTGQFAPQNNGLAASMAERSNAGFAAREDARQEQAAMGNGQPHLQ